MNFIRHHYFRRARRSGFTLIEVLVALIIFTIAIFALMQGLTETLAIESSLGDRQRALMLAENILEEIKYSGEFEEGEEEGEFDGDAAGFKWATNVVETDTLGLMEVTITVRWPEHGNEKEVILSTLMYDNLSGSM